MAGVSLRGTVEQRGGSCVSEAGHGRGRRESAAPLFVDSAHGKRHVLHAAGRDGGIPLLSGGGGGKCICSQRNT